MGRSGSFRSGLFFERQEDRMSRGTRILLLSLICGIVAIGIALVIMGVIPTRR